MLVVAVVAIGAIALFVRHRTRVAAMAAASASASAGERVVPVSVTVVRRRDVPIELEGLGSVIAFNTVTLKPQVEGRIEKVLFKEGDSVHRGDVLVQLDPRPFAVQVQLAKATLARDQAGLANARINLDRTKKLVEGGVGSQQQLDDATAALAQAEAVVAGDAANISSAALNLEFARVVSPIEGVVGVRLIDVGNLVSPNDQTGLVVITQIDPIAVLFTLPEDELPRVNQAQLAGKELDVVAYARDGTTKLGVGKLAVVDNQINPSTATMRLKAIFPNPDRQLWPGLFVKARLALGVRPDAIVVPSTVVQRGPQGTFAYVVNADDTVALRNVQVEATQGELSILSSGLEPGERVVVDGQNLLRPGAKIAAKPMGAASASASARASSTLGSLGSGASGAAPSGSARTGPGVGAGPPAGVGPGAGRGMSAGAGAEGAPGAPAGMGRGTGTGKGTGKGTGRGGGP